MYHTTGSQAYAAIELESSVMNATPHQLIMMLFDGALNALTRARLHLEAGQIPQKGTALSKAINIIDNGLKGGLNNDGSELAENLAALYDYMVQRLMYANLHNDPAILRHVAELLQNIADAWRQIAPQPQLADKGE